MSSFARSAGSAVVMGLTALLIDGCVATAAKVERPTASTSQPQPPPIQSRQPTTEPPVDVARIADPVPRDEPRSRYGNPVSYVVFGQRYTLLSMAQGYVERGTASWYGPGFHAERTSSGETYDMYGMTAAHKTLPIPVYAEVTNLRNGRRVVVRINDRGPFVGDRLIDLSYTAAAKLDMLREGTAPVEVRVVSGATAADIAPTLVAAVPPLPNNATSPRERMFVQAGAFSSADTAARLAGRLAAEGIANVALVEADSNGRHLYRVRVGPVQDRIEAEDMQERLALLGIADARIAIH